MNENLENLNVLLNPLGISAEIISEIKISMGSSTLFSYDYPHIVLKLSQKDTGCLVMGVCKTADDHAVFCSIDDAYRSIFCQIAYFKSSKDHDFHIDNIYLGCKNIEEAFIRKDLLTA